MRIRPATNDDGSRIWTVHARAIRHGCASHYDAADIAAWCDRMSPASCADLLQSRTMLVAEDDDGRVVGFAQMEPTEGVIEGVYVEPRAQRKGAGRALVARLEREAARARLPGLLLDASLNAVPFYAALGYAVQGDVRHALGHGRTIACKVMSKRLPAPATDRVA